MQEQMSKIARTTDPQERQRLCKSNGRACIDMQTAGHGPMVTDRQWDAAMALVA
jgi:hypothetical protein